MALAAFDEFARIKAPRPAAFGGLDALAIDNPGVGRSVAAKPLAGSEEKRVVDGGPSSFVPPGVEIALHRRGRREVLWQHPPLAAGGGDEEDRVHHPAQLRRPLAAEALGLWHERRDQAPLGIAGVACISRAAANIVAASGFGPSHRDLLRIFANPKESQPAGITHPFLGQALRR